MAGRGKVERLRALKFKVRKYFKVVRLRKLVWGYWPKKMRFAVVLAGL